MFKGNLLICVAKGSNEFRIFDKKFYNEVEFFNRNEVNSNVLYTYPVTGRETLKRLLKNLVAAGIVPNIIT